MLINKKGKNNSAYYKHTIAIKVMHAIMKHKVPAFPTGSLDCIPVWQQNIIQKLEPLLLELRTKNDSTVRSKAILPTINQLNEWSRQFLLNP